jgi:hypothetical protein
VIVRRFNQSGIAEFRQFLATCRQSPATGLPRGILEENALTETIKPAIQIEPRKFATRRDAASYLRKALSPLPEQEVAEDAGLWSWLSLFYFDEICPANNCRGSVKNDYSYIFEPKNQRHFYRHLLFIGWHVLRVTEKHNRLFLDQPLSSLDKVTSEVMKRLFLTRIPCVFEVLDRIYWDAKRGRIRRGVTDFGNVKPGDLVHRFPIRVRQLEKTYDLLTLKADQLIELLGEEFGLGMLRIEKTRSASNSPRGK